MFIWLFGHNIIFREFEEQQRRVNTNITDKEIEDQHNSNFVEWFRSHVRII